MRLLVLLIFPALFSAFGELSPAVYEQKQNSASEHLQLHILRVTASTEQARTQVYALALVTQVVRTSSHIKSGDTLKILYSIATHPPRWCGPGEIPLLKEEQDTVAYLNRLSGEDSYVPAAGVMSFRDF